VQSSGRCNESTNPLGPPNSMSPAKPIGSLGSALKIAFNCLGPVASDIFLPWPDPRACLSKAVRNAFQLACFPGVFSAADAWAAWRNLNQDLRAGRLVCLSVRWTAAFRLAEQLSQHSAAMGHPEPGRPARRRGQGFADRRFRFVRYPPARWRRPWGLQVSP
jgi:hypothetical protein